MFSCSYQSLPRIAHHTAAAATFDAAEIHRVLACRPIGSSSPKQRERYEPCTRRELVPLVIVPPSILQSADPIGVSKKPYVILLTRSSVESRVRAAYSRLRVLFAMPQTRRPSASNKMASSRHEGRQRCGRYCNYIVLCNCLPFWYGLHAHEHQQRPSIKTTSQASSDLKADAVLDHLPGRRSSL